MTDNQPLSKEVKGFNFKLKCRLKVFGQLKIDSPTNLIATASKYGVIFAGTPTGVQCIKTESIFSLDVDHRHNKNIAYYPRRNLQLGVQPSHLSVNADNEFLAVALIPRDCAALFVYSVASFGSIELLKKYEVRLSTVPGVTVSDLQWNPGMANMLAVVMSDGSAAVIEFNDSSFAILGSVPHNSQASCLCWSPKGKQVVIGAKNGSLTQYKPELKAMRTFPPPQLPGTSSTISVVSVHWLSNFQFIAAYKCASDSSARASIMIVNVPRNSPPTYVNYEDLCFGSSTSRPEHYFIHQAEWNILIVGTTNSMEANVLGMEGDNWAQWMLDDGGRAELPLTEDHQDVFNIGMGFDISPTQPVSIGENLTIEPMPLLVMLSHDGVLCFFQAINTIQGSPRICVPPQPFPDSSGLHLFNQPEAGDASSLPSPLREEPKASGVGELGEQLGQAVQPSIPNTLSSPLTLGKPVPGQATGPLGQALPPFAMNLSFGQPSPGQPITFNQPSFASTSANQSLVTNVPKFSLPAPVTMGQPSPPAPGGASLGGLGQSPIQPVHHQISSPASNIFGTTGGPVQSTWSSELSQRIPAQKSNLVQSPAVSSKQPTPTQPNLVQPQPQVMPAGFPGSPSILGHVPPISIPVTSSSLPNFQPQHVTSSSQEGASPLIQLPMMSGTNPPSTIQFHPSQVNKSPQSQIIVSSDSQVPVVPIGQLPVPQTQPSSGPQSQPSFSPQTQPSFGPQTHPSLGHQSQPSRLASVPEVEEEPDEKEIMKEMDICQELLRHFSVEMEQKQRAIKYISSQTEYNIGESKSKDQVIQDIETLRKFEEELKEAGAPDQADVNALGCSILEIFGWYEKIKAKERMAKNPGYIELMESQDLDPITRSYLNNIDRYVYYLESQIKQAKAKLGSLWDNIGSPNFEVPVMEVIFQSLVAQLNVLAAKKAIVDSCESKMKKFNKNRVLRNPRRYVGDLELSTLAERLLDTRISDTDLLQDTSIRDASNNYIMLSKRMAKKNLNEEKVGALHQWHKNHKVITTKVTKKNAIVINSDFSKDETFCRIISPSKQSTPYVHTTPKKVSTSIPRKSLFTITSNMSNGQQETNEINLGLSNLDIESNLGLVEKQSSILPNSTDGSIKLKSVTNSIDSISRNNLAISVSKVVEANKIDGLHNTSNIQMVSTTQGTSLHETSPVSTSFSKESIPTPAAFKDVQIQFSTKGKNDNVISTSWGAQAPVFSQSFVPPNISASMKASVPSSSVSAFSDSSIGTSGQVTTTPSTSSINSFSFSLGGNVVNQGSVGTKFTFPQPTATPATNSFTSTNQKTNVTTVPSSTDKELYEPAVTAITSIYTPTPIKFTTTSANTFGFSSTTENSFNLPSSVSITSPVNRTFSTLNSNTTPTSVSNSYQLSSTSATTGSSNVPNIALPTSSSVPLFGGSSPISASLTLPKAVTTNATTSGAFYLPPGTVIVTTSSTVTTLNQQLPVSTLTFINVPQASINTTSSVTETEASPKSSTVTWSGGNIFAASTSTNTSVQLPANSSSTTNASIFGGTAVLGSLKTPVATTQSFFGGPPVFASVSSATTTPPIFSSSSVTTTANLFGTVSATPTATVFGSVNTVSSTSTFPVSSVTIASAPGVTTSASTSAPNFGTAAVSISDTVFGTSTNATTVSPIFGYTSTTSSSVFASPSAISSSSTLFGASSVTTSAPVFGSTSTTASNFSSSPTTTSTSIFGGVVVTAVTTSSAFDTAKQPIFGGTPKTTASVFGTATTSASFFGSNSVFGAPSTTTSSIFGAAANTTTTSTVFGTTNTTTTSSGFGSTTTTTATSVFGPPATSIASSVFGAATTTASSSVFGSVTTTTTASLSFGSTNTTTASVFGSVSTTTSSSVFGSVTTTTASSVFGTPTTTTTPSVFGATNTTTSSVFGAVNATTSSVFGTANTTVSSSAFAPNNNQANSIFGATAALSSTPFFGSPTTTSSSSFGNQSAASIFGGSSSFGTPNPPTTNSFFSKAICSPASTTTSVFGTSSNVFGAATTTTTASSIFGGSNFQQKSPFGQATANVFGQTSSSGAGNFGSSGGSLFGGTTSFGSPPAQGNIFQSGGTANIFGGAAANTSPFSGSSPTASQPAFGSPPSFQAAQRPFGTAAPPVFGGQSTFGAAPTFGGSPSFGSPGKVFGTPPPTNTQSFGNPTQQSSTFENLANQDTLSFGNLAQQQAFPTTSFGGSSFSSWRS